jgi:hypothetical protein
LAARRLQAQTAVFIGGGACLSSRLFLEESKSKTDVENKRLTPSLDSSWKSRGRLMGDTLCRDRNSGAPHPAKLEWNCVVDADIPPGGILFQCASRIRFAVSRRRVGLRAVSSSPEIQARGKQKSKKERK